MHRNRLPTTGPEVECSYCYNNNNNILADWRGNFIFYYCNARLTRCKIIHYRSNDTVNNRIQNYCIIILCVHNSMRFVPRSSSIIIAEHVVIIIDLRDLIDDNNNNIINACVIIISIGARELFSMSKDSVVIIRK